MPRRRSSTTSAPPARATPHPSRVRLGGCAPASPRAGGAAGWGGPCSPVLGVWPGGWGAVSPRAGVRLCRWGSPFLPRGRGGLSGCTLKSAAAVISRDGVVRRCRAGRCQRVGAGVAPPGCVVWRPAVAAVLGRRRLPASRGRGARFRCGGGFGKALAFPLLGAGAPEFGVAADLGGAGLPGLSVPEASASPASGWGEGACRGAPSIRRGGDQPRWCGSAVPCRPLPVGQGRCGGGFGEAPASPPPV